MLGLKFWEIEKVKKAWVKPLRDRKGKTVLNGFVDIVNESNSKLNTLCADQEK